MKKPNNEKKQPETEIELENPLSAGELPSPQVAIPEKLKTSNLDDDLDNQLSSSEKSELTGGDETTLHYHNVLIFSDGSDGNVDVNSTTFTSGPITNNSLTRDAYFNNLTLSGGNLDPNGYKVFVKGKLTTNNGYKIYRNGANGGNASGNTPGTGAPALAGGTLAGGVAGEDGGATDYYSSGGSSPGNGYDGGDGSSVNPGCGSDGANGGPGGTGYSTAGAGGAGGTVTERSIPSDLFTTLSMLTYDGTSVVPIKGSAGAGSGGGGSDCFVDSNNYGYGGSGGGSGASGGVILISAKEIVNSGSIEAKGGAGGNGGDGADVEGFCGNSGGGGGGAGGSGGVIILIYRSFSGNSPDVSGGIGGAGGTGVGTGHNGSAGSLGSDGQVYTFKI